MSIIILGKSTCPLCGKVIEEGEKYYAFAPFVYNPKDPLYLFNDEGCHQECLARHELGPTAISYNEQYIARSRPANRKCIVTGEPITKMENHIWIGYLTADTNAFLHGINFTHIDRRNLALWKDRPRVIEEATQLMHSDKWDEPGSGKYLTWLISELSPQT